MLQQMDKKKRKQATQNIRATINPAKGCFVKRSS